MVLCYCLLVRQAVFYGETNITPHTVCESVVRTTSKVNGKCQISGSGSSETLGSIFNKICWVDYVVDPTPHANIGSIGSKGACLHMREIVTPRRLFFSLFLMVHAPRYRSARLTDRRR